MSDYFVSTSSKIDKKRIGYMNTDLKISKTKDKVVYFKNRPYCDEKNTTL